MTWTNVAPEQSAATRTNVYTLQIPVVVSNLSKKHSAFDELVDALENDESCSNEFIEAGEWFTKNFTDGSRTIRTERLRKGLSQKQLAHILETSQPQIAKLESGKVDPQFSTCQKLCVALDLTPNELHEILSNQQKRA